MFKTFIKSIRRGLHKTRRSTRARKQSGGSGCAESRALSPAQAGGKRTRRNRRNRSVRRRR